MKNFGSIFCISSALMLSSCTLTQQQQQQQAVDDKITEQPIEGDQGTEQPEVSKKNTEAHEESALLALEKAEEQELKEAEAAAAEKTARTPQLLSSRRRAKADTAAPTPETEAPRETEDEKPAEEIAPTPEQQEAARKMLEQEPAPAPRKKAAPAPVPEPAPVRDELQLPGSELRGGLRTRRFAPPEEAISRDDNDAPLPNSVELRGLRSPVMKGRLPMNIDGKIIKED
ncbi:MAG: hypothetical protein IJE88_01900 [Akkermansia sp.]|nr:hypothetical protein [Akkermansia sp.]